jgi:predicted transcriptional regulator
MNTFTVEQTEKTKELLLHKLRERQAPMSLQELEANLDREVTLSHRTLKEAAWQLVEEGKAQFTVSWDLEIR